MNVEKLFWQHVADLAAATTKEEKAYKSGCLDALFILQSHPSAEDTEFLLESLGDRMTDQRVKGQRLMLWCYLMLWRAE